MNSNNLKKENACNQALFLLIELIWQLLLVDYKVLALPKESK
jgi:hypothetical protein